MEKTNLTSAVLEAEVGEPPDVAETDGVGDAAHSEVVLTAPLAPLTAILTKYLEIIWNFSGFF